jgi:hypothetical protein
MAVSLAATRRFLEEQQLNVLLEKYDGAADGERKERIAEEIFQLTAPAIRGIIAARAKGRLGADPIESLAWQATYEGLAGHSRTRFRLTDAEGNDWTGALRWVQAMAGTGQPEGRSLWYALPEEVRDRIAGTQGHLDVRVQHQALGAINDALMRPDLFPPQAYRTLGPRPDAAELLAKEPTDWDRSERTYLNALVVQSLLPQLRPPQRRPLNFIGHVARVVAPKLVPVAVAEEQGWQQDRDAVTALGQLRPDIEREAEMERSGQLPDGWQSLPKAERVRRLQLERIRRDYGDRLRWWEDTTRRLGRPLRISGGQGWSAAKELFRRHDVDPQLYLYGWSPYFLPRRVAHPYGAERIERALALVEGRRPAPLSESVSVVAATPTAGRGLDRDVYRHAVLRLYSGPGRAAEKAVGLFLAGTVRPGLEGVQRWLSTLPEDVATDIRDMGFQQVARLVDEGVRGYISEEPGALRELEEAVGAEAGAVKDAVASVRSIILLRLALGFPDRDWLCKTA